jgi:hypothetical protein
MSNEIKIMGKLGYYAPKVCDMRNIFKFVGPETLT